MSSPIAHVRQTLSVLRQYYAGRDGQPHQLNDVQATVYVDGLAGFSSEALEAAARTWMRQSAFFPRLSDLLSILDPPVDMDSLAHAAWARLEREIRRIGAYRSVQFADAAFGVAVRETFGGWPQACRFDVDSPGWAIRRQTFLAMFKAAVGRKNLEAVTLIGQHRDQAPALIGPLEGLPSQPLLTAQPDRSAEVMARITKHHAVTTQGIKT